MHTHRYPHHSVYSPYTPPTLLANILPNSTNSQPITASTPQSCLAAQYVPYMLQLQCKSPSSRSCQNIPKLTRQTTYTPLAPLTLEQIATQIRHHPLLHTRVSPQQIHTSHCVPLSQPAHLTTIFMPKHHTVWSQRKTYLVWQHLSNMLHIIQHFLS